MFDQMNLFATDDNDLSHVAFWGPEDFIKLVTEGKPEQFSEAMAKRGVKEEVIQRILSSIGRSAPKKWEHFVSLALKPHPITKQFVYGSSQEAVTENKNTAMIALLARPERNTTEAEFLRALFHDNLKEWVGTELWELAPYSGGDPFKWVESLAVACGWLDEVRTSGADLISAAVIKRGDIILARTFSGQFVRGVVVGGEITPQRDGSSYGSLRVWVLQEHVQTWVPDSRVQSTNAFVTWFGGHPLLGELLNRRVVRVGAKNFYHLGHMEELETYQVDNAIVWEAILSLPLPETPDVLWDMMRTSHSDWLSEFHSSALHDALFHFMSQYDISHCKRVLENSAVKPGKRGSWIDRLPSDEMVMPLVSALVETESVVEVQNVLQSFYWVTFEYNRYSVCMIDHDCSCYDGLYKAGLAQSKDKDFITYILRQYAINCGVFGAGMVQWSPETGLTICPPEEDATKHWLRRYEDVTQALESATFLGLFNRSEHPMTDDEDLVADDDGGTEDEMDEIDCEDEYEEFITDEQMADIA